MKTEVNVDSLGPAADLISNFSGEDYEVSTFKKLAEYGLVFGIELSHLTHVTDETLIEVQWKAAEILIQSLLMPISNRPIT